MSERELAPVTLSCILRYAFDPVILPCPAQGYRQPRITDNEVAQEINLNICLYVSSTMHKYPYSCLHRPSILLGVALNLPVMKSISMLPSFIWRTTVPRPTMTRASSERVTYVTPRG